MKVKYNKEVKQIVDNAVFPIVIDETYGQGLTKREYFTAMAMQGILANPEITKNYKDLNIEEAAIKFADALLTELNKEDSHE